MGNYGGSLFTIGTRTSEENAQDFSTLIHENPMLFFQKYHQKFQNNICAEILKNNLDVAQWYLKQDGFKDTDFLKACINWEQNVEVVLGLVNHALHSSVVCAIIAKYPAYAYYINDLSDLNLLHYYEISDILIAMANHKDCLSTILEIVKQAFPEHSAKKMHVLAACIKLDEPFALEMVKLYPNHDLILSSVVSHYKNFALQYSRMKFSKHNIVCCAIRSHIEVANEFVNSVDYNSMCALIKHPSLHSTILNRKDLSRSVLLRLISAHRSVAEHYVYSDDMDILSQLKNHYSLFEKVALRSNLPSDFYAKYSDSIHKIRDKERNK